LLLLFLSSLARKGSGEGDGEVGENNLVGCSAAPLRVEEADMFSASSSTAVGSLPSPAGAKMYTMPAPAAASSGGRRMMVGVYGSGEPAKAETPPAIPRIVAAVAMVKVAGLPRDDAAIRRGRPAGDSTRRRCRPRSPALVSTSAAATDPAGRDVFLAVRRWYASMVRQLERKLWWRWSCVTGRAALSSTSCPWRRRRGMDGDAGMLC
jgi:hypothetical protein